MSQIHRGSIKFFLRNKGWGFITPDEGGRDVFFRSKEFSNPFLDIPELQISRKEFHYLSGRRSPEKGARVGYNPLVNQKGIMAKPWTHEDLWDLAEQAFKDRQRKTPRHISQVHTIEDFDLLTDQIVMRLFR